MKLRQWLNTSRPLAKNRKIPQHNLWSQSDKDSASVSHCFLSHKFRFVSSLLYLLTCSVAHFYPVLEKVITFFFFKPWILPLNGLWLISTLTVFQEYFMSERKGILRQEMGLNVKGFFIAKDTYRCCKHLYVCNLVFSL